MATAARNFAEQDSRRWPFITVQKRDVTTTLAPDRRTMSQVVDHDADDLAFRSLRLVVSEALGDLPEVQQQMILRRIDGCQVEEIATETGRSKRTVERVLQNFRDRLREIIDEPAHGSNNTHP